MENKIWFAVFVLYKVSSKFISVIASKEFPQIFVVLQLSVFYEIQFDSWLDWNAFLCQVAGGADSTSVNICSVTKTFQNFP